MIRDSALSPGMVSVVVLWGNVDVWIGESTNSPLNNLMTMRRGGLVVVVCLGPADASHACSLIRLFTALKRVKGCQKAR